MIEIRVQAERIDLTTVPFPGDLDGAMGAVVTFTGYCRDEEGRLATLELEHYPGMAEREIRSICEDAQGRWPLMAAKVVHRHGTVRPGEEIVYVACASRHRGAAFEAASFIMDFMKTRAPFWKREHLADGSVGGWVESRDTDDHAADRWHRL